MNCRLDGLADKMSEFETAAFNWYVENAGRFALESGLMADLVRSEGLAGRVLRLFVQALSKVHVSFERIAGEQAREAAERN